MSDTSCTSALLFGLASALVSCARQPSTQTSTWFDHDPAPAIAGLRVNDGRPFRLSDQKGSAVLLSFGYTSCLELCPDTFATVHRVLNALDAQAARVRFVYVTVDPERDRPEPFAKFMASVDPRFQGIFLDQQRLLPVLSAYHVTVRKRVPDPESYARRDVDPTGYYTLDHSSGFWLIDPAGRLRARFLHEAPDAEIVSGVRTVLQEPN